MDENVIGKIFIIILFFAAIPISKYCIETYGMNAITLYGSYFGIVVIGVLLLLLVRLGCRKLR